MHLFKNINCGGKPSTGALPEAAVNRQPTIRGGPRRSSRRFCFCVKMCTYIFKCISINISVTTVI